MARSPKLREASPSQDDLLSLPVKKFKSTKKHKSAGNFPPEFYDSLSKVHLTRRALRELDRRNQLKSSIRAQVAMPKPIRESTPEELQRFARRGGVELDDLRGVRNHPPYNVRSTINYASSVQSRRA
jgi:hypothetical protein